MKLYVLLIALLMCVGALLPVQGRAVDDADNSIEDNELEGKSAVEDIDNSIEDTETQRRSQRKNTNNNSYFGKMWIKLTKPPPKTIHQTDKAIEIYCEVMGSPTPTIEWLSGDALRHRKYDSLESNAVPEGSLSTIVRVYSIHVINHMLTVPTVYTCVGRAGSLLVNSSTTVYPNVELNRSLSLIHFHPKRMPRIIYSELVHFDLQGTTIELPCKVRARPYAEVYWLDNNNNSIEGYHKRYAVMPNGALRISDMQWADMGTFVCMARNSYGHHKAETFVYPVKRDDDA